MKKLLSIVFIGSAVVAYGYITEAAATSPSNSAVGAPRVYIHLPNDVVTPDGITLDSKGNTLISAPNFSNEFLLKEGVIAKALPEKIVIFDPHKHPSDFYVFSDKDKHPSTGKVGPMELAFGPDGNLYVADMQVLWNGEHKSRLLRINVKDGKATGMDVVVEGFIVANGLAWKGNTLFVSESILEHPAKTPEGEPKPLLKSGVYAFTLDELKRGKTTLIPFGKDQRDAHLVVVLHSNNSKGFGADGLAFDHEGNLYTSIVEDGSIYKTTFTKNNKPLKTKLFAKDPQMISADGMVFDPISRKLYTASFFGNAVHAIDMKGRVSTLHKNGDTHGADGSLDQPAALVIKGDDLLVTNMDVAWMAPAVNQKTDKPFTISAIKIRR